MNRFTSRRQNPWPLFTALVLTGGLLLNVSAHADCKVHYDQSMELLNTELLKSKEPKTKTKTDLDAFEASFKDAVQQLQTEKCLPELMSLIQHIQTEQQKHPRTTQNKKPAPIVD